MTGANSYRMPSEWHAQAGTWLAWPHNTDTWQHNLAQAQREFVVLARMIARHQRVSILCGGSAWKQAEQAFRPVDPNIHLIDITTNDAWVRDYGPTFVIDRRPTTAPLIAIDWHYNAWGGKYPPFDDDQKVARRVAKHLNIECVSTDFCFEGGAIEINDSGVLLTTKSCACDPRRNSVVSVEFIENVLTEHLGARKIVWLTGDALEGDDTDGHIDQLARFTDDRTIVYAWTDDTADPQAPALQQNLDDLKSGLTAAGDETYRLVPLPIPEPVSFRDNRLPASYCNFVITNDQVIVPQFGVTADEQALEILTPLFPTREVSGLPSYHLSCGLGSFHCLSQQQPKVPGKPIPSG